MATRLRITGQVQGVGYRAAFASQAHALRLYGWVRNRQDGTVEAAVAGQAQAILHLIAWAEHGPPGAQVHSVAVIEIDDGSVADGEFRILPTV